MKKRLLFVSMLVFSIFFNIVVAGAANITLKDIADSFNNCKTVNSYKEYGMDLSAKAEDNKLIIRYKAGDIDANTEYLLKDSIISAVIKKEDAMPGLFTATILVDSIGKLHGYQDGDMFDTLNTEEIQKYTVEKEGFEVKEIDNGGYEIKVDIDKKIPLVDMSEKYIKISDLDEVEIDILKSKEHGNINGIKGPLSYYVGKFDNIEIYVAERGGLTNRAYNTLLTFIELLFDKDKVEYFKENYENFVVGNKTFDDFNIELNVKGDVPTARDGFSVLKLTIGDVDNGKEDINNSYEGDAIDDRRSVIRKEIIICFSVICVLGIGGLCFMALEKRKNK